MKNKINKEKIINFIDKYIIVFEFVISLVFIYSIYKVIAEKAGNNYLNIPFLIIGIIFAIFQILILIRNFKINRDKLEKIIISLLMPVSFCYVFFMTPGYVPDENSHIWYAYEISTGTIIKTKENNGGFATPIPGQLFEFTKEDNTTLKRYIDYDNEIKNPTNYEGKIEVETPARGYPTFLYMFSACGFLIARIFNLSVIVGVYLARIFNLIFFFAMIYFAIKKVSFGKWIFVIIAFLPMTLQQAASVSYDSFINSISIFYIAYTIYLSRKDEKYSKKTKILYVLISAIIAMSKFAYAPLIAISFLLLRNKKETKKEKIIFILSTIIISAIACITMFKIVSLYPSTASKEIYYSTTNVDPGKQLSLTISEPIHIFKAMKTSISQGMWIDGLIGKELGWMDIEVPNFVIGSFLLLLIISPFLGEYEKEKYFNKLEKLLSVLIYIGTYILIFIAFYFTWTTPGWDTVFGIQGRYFIPIAATLLLPLAKDTRIIKGKNLVYYIPMICVLLNAVTILKLIQFFG